MVADVAEIGGAEQRIADGVNEHIGIAVAEESECVLNVHTAQPQVATFDETMHVVTVTYSDVHVKMRELGVND